MKIGIDIDDTITDTEKVLLECMKEYNSALNETEMHDLNDDFWRQYGGEIYSRVKFKPGVKAAFEALKAWGFEIVIITAREYRETYDIKQITENMFENEQVPYDKIIYNSIPKGPDAKEQGVSLFIDDLERNLESVGTHGIDCVKIVKHYQNNKNYREFNNWDDLLLYIKLWGREKNGN